ncbi:MAG: two pore domain potassium channel family protein [Saprospiraceae bacterium]|jgi:voltage-gated potassium channel|nr:two pore domain potassium channel family protein [Saprospiraceae bacterium]
MLIFKAILSFLRDKEYLELLYTTTIVLILGTVVFHYVEGWRWLDSLYFCVITLTTIGYGDFTPRTDLGKIFNIFYIIIGLGLILSFIQTIRDHYMNIKQKNL